MPTKAKATSTDGMPEVLLALRKAQVDIHRLTGHRVRVAVEANLHDGEAAVCFGGSVVVRTRP